MTGILLSVIALIGGTVHSGFGEPQTGVVILVESGVITAMGEDVPIPPSAERIQVGEGWVTPGFIDPFTRLGLVEIGGVAASNDTSSSYPHPVRSSQRAVDSLNPHSALIPIQRFHGVATVLTTLGGGIVSGQAAVMSLGTGAVLRAPAGFVTRFGGRAGGNRGETVAFLRTLLDDARAYRLNQEAFLANRFRPLAAHRLDLEALGPLLDGQMPLFIQANRRSDIRVALEFARQQEISVVLVGAREAWLEREAIAESGVSVIVNPADNLPNNFDGIHSDERNIVHLIRAGISVAISTFSAHQVRKLRQWAGNAVRAGLSHNDAMGAVTATPARILGLNRRGSLAVGQVADIVVWSGDPFELSTQVRHLIIDGRQISLAHRQQALFTKYRTLDLPVQRPLIKSERDQRRGGAEDVIEP
ncbi:MAG: amidohydrolase family protein [Myxococcota bacterium]|nr:amidohydrolase family protein [Myxococcota bacterium]